MEELGDGAQGDRFDDLTSLGPERVKPCPLTLELCATDRLGPSPQRGYDRSRGPGRRRDPVARELLGENRADDGDLTAARRHLRLRKSPHVLHVQQPDSLEACHGGVYVSWNSDVDHQQGPVGARPHHPADAGHVEHHVRRRRRGQHDVSPPELVVQLREAHRLCARLLRDRGCPLGGTVRYHDAGQGRRLRERPAEPRSHLSCPDDQHRAALETAFELIGRESDGGVRERRRPLCDRGLGTHALSGLDRMTEQRP